MIYVGDDFFKDPYNIRQTALKQEYTKVRNTFPGLRSLLPEEIKNKILTEVRYLLKDSSLIMTESSFQFITKDYREGTFHHDGDSCDQKNYTSINFLSLESPPNSGTEVCETTGDPDLTGVVPMEMWGRHLKLKESFYENPKGFINGYKYDRMRERINSRFNPVAQIPNKFNRFLLFSGSQHHRAQKFFGTSVADARLTIVSFFN